MDGHGWIDFTTLRRIYIAPNWNGFVNTGHQAL